jgi:hypothetical protein
MSSDPDLRGGCRPGAALYAWRRGDADWSRVADLHALGLRGVTRLGVSPNGNLVAFVTQAR